MELQRTIVALLIIVWSAQTSSGGKVRQHTHFEAYFPLDSVVAWFEGKPASTPKDHDRLAGALALHGLLKDAQQTLSTSSQLETRAEPNYILGSIYCRMHRLSEASAAFAKGYSLGFSHPNGHQTESRQGLRGATNIYEFRAANTNLCPQLPLLFPPESVLAEHQFPLFPHYAHTERLYLVRDSASPLMPPVHPFEYLESHNIERQGDGDSHGRLIKQLSGNAAVRESNVLSVLGSVEHGLYSRHFPRVYANQELDAVSRDAGGLLWSAYEVDHVRTVGASAHIGSLVDNKDVAGLTTFVEGCLSILKALEASGVRHNSLDATSFLVSQAGDPVVVDFEVAHADWLEPPTSASMQHRRKLHEHGSPSDHVSLGQSLKELLHMHDVHAFDCLIAPLVSRSAEGPEGHSTLDEAASNAFRVRGTTTDSAYTVERECVIPSSMSWSAYLPDVLQVEEAEEDSELGEDGLAEEGPSIEPAGAPPFDHNMALYELDTLLMPGSGLPSLRLAEFFAGMGAELPAIQEDAVVQYREAYSKPLASQSTSRIGEMVSAGSLGCWDRHHEGVQYAVEVLGNASECWDGLEEACRYSRAQNLPSIDALAHGYSLDELLVLHRAWGDWFGARFPPSEAHTFSLDASLSFPPPDRLTVIYASSHTFMNHGSHYTLIGVFEAHDLAKIRPVHLLMVGDQDIKFAGDLPSKHEFLDITHMGDQETAMAINEMGAHILLDLTGYLSGTRLAIAALRPTPLCVHHFAQPSTMGAPDYVQSFLSDSIITPPEHQPFYTEALSYLPGIFLSTSARRFNPEALTFPPGKPYPRVGLDLPVSDGPLLCSFNAFYKVQPRQFAAWARVLKSRPQATLVLRAKNGAEGDCFARELEAAGLSKDRVHFTGDLSGDAHMRRCAACDLILDTDNFNGITTTATVLWASSPVVTYATENNAGRCAATMLLSMGGHTLIARDRADYEALLLLLTGEDGGKRLLSAARQNLSGERVKSKLFDPRHLAEGYERMFSRLWDVQLGADGKAGTHSVVLTHISKSLASQDSANLAQGYR